MANILANPNTVPTRADLAVHADGSLDLANYVAEILPNPDAVLGSLGGNVKEYSKLRRDDQVAALMQRARISWWRRSTRLCPAGRPRCRGGGLPARAVDRDPV